MVSGFYLIALDNAGLRASVECVCIAGADCIIIFFFRFFLLKKKNQY